MSNSVWNEFTGEMIIILGIFEFILILGYPKPFPIGILNIVIGTLFIVGGFIIMRLDRIYHKK